MNQRLLLDPNESAVLHPEEYPLTVREAAKYLGVSPQSVYLWVERKQIPHLRVMGRNIRFLKSDLETFRAKCRCWAHRQYRYAQPLFNRPIRAQFVHSQGQE
jgi:excisionase family DNA binding protein